MLGPVGAGVLAQSQQMASSAKQLLASAQSGGFGFQPEAADTMIKALHESILDLHTLRHHLDAISQKPKLGRTPAAVIVSPFTRRVGTDEQGVVPAIQNLEQILTDMVLALQQAKINYADSDATAANHVHRLRRA